MVLLKFAALGEILVVPPDSQRSELIIYLAAGSRFDGVRFFEYSGAAHDLLPAGQSGSPSLEQLSQALRASSAAALTIRPSNPRLKLASYAVVPGTQLGIVASEGRQSLYQNVNRKLLAFMAGPVILAVIGAIGIFLLVRELVGRAEELESKQRMALEEKEVLLKEIHHRVKNNLQVISSLLKLKAKGLKDHAARKPLDESQDRVHSIALVHDLLYHSASVAEIDFEEYLQKLVERLVSTYGAPADTVKVDGDEVRLDIDTAIPCGLLVTELVTNALRHAFPHGNAGQVAVEMQRKNGNYILSVSDNGVGMPEVLRPGSLGLTLVESLVRQLQGSHECERSGGGTKHRISFPVPERRPHIWDTSQSD
jgi:two-component sensor histidine kinase